MLLLSDDDADMRWMDDGPESMDDIPIIDVVVGDVVGEVGDVGEGMIVAVGDVTELLVVAVMAAIVVVVFFFCMCGCVSRYTSVI